MHERSLEEKLNQLVARVSLLEARVLQAERAARPVEAAQTTPGLMTFTVLQKD